jgi:hypothetical protein
MLLDYEKVIALILNSIAPLKNMNYICKLMQPLVDIDPRKQYKRTYNYTDII